MVYLVDLTCHSAIPRETEVWADWHGLASPALVGLLHAAPAPGKDAFSFEYDDAWLASGPALALDPRLGLFAGPQFAPEQRDNLSVFLDSSLDRWGRTLRERREAHLARVEKRAL